MTRELSVCDGPMVEEATQCAAKPTYAVVADECGCDGLACAPDKFCRAEVPTCSCAGYQANLCTDKPCQTPADCPDGSICIPSQFIVRNRCLVPQCRADADCTEAPGGVCGLGVDVPSQAGMLSLREIRCFYPGEF